MGRLRIRLIRTFTVAFQVTKKKTKQVPIFSFSHNATSLTSFHSPFSPHWKTVLEFHSLQARSNFKLRNKNFKNSRFSINGRKNSNSYTAKASCDTSYSLSQWGKTATLDSGTARQSRQKYRKVYQKFGLNKGLFYGNLVKKPIYS